MATSRGGVPRGGTEVDGAHGRQRGLSIPEARRLENPLRRGARGVVADLLAPVPVAGVGHRDRPAVAADVADRDRHPVARLDAAMAITGAVVEVALAMG